MKELILQLIPSIPFLTLDLVEEGIEAFIEEGEAGNWSYSNMIMPHLIRRKLELNETEY